MELFTIQCTTCKARLIVKDESVIGDILSCPKCNSMVQVVPPIGWQGHASGDSSPGELISAPAAALPSVQKASPSPAPPKKTAAAAIPPALPPKTAAATAAPTDVAPSLFAAAAAWARRDWIVLSGGLLGGVVLGSVIWLVASVQSPPEVIVVDAAKASAGPTAPKPASTPPPENREPPTETPPQITPPTNETEKVAPETSATAQDAAKPPAEEKAAKESAPQEASKKPALKLEPIPSSSTGPSDVGTILAPAQPTPSAGNDAPAEPAANNQKSGDASATTPGAPAPQESATLDRDQIEKRLAVSLSRVEFVEVPLAQFAVFVADVTGVRVTIDDAGLTKAGKGRRTPVTVKLDQTTAGDVLRAALERAGLVSTIKDGGIVVSTAGE